MINKLIVAISCAWLCQVALAETCPSVNEIKRNALSNWKAYDSDEGTPLPPTREAQLIRTAEQFVLAEWATGKNKHGSIHCYYRDSTGSSLEAYFAKENVVPKKTTNNFWYEVSGFMHCAAGMDKCEFEKSLLQSPTMKNRQLAKR